jgi:hypothetical protein
MVQGERPMVQGEEQFSGKSDSEGERFRGEE